MLNSTVFTVPSQMPQALSRALLLVAAGASFVRSVSLWFPGSERLGIVGLGASILSLGGKLRPESRHR